MPHRGDFINRGVPGALVVALLVSSGALVGASGVGCGGADTQDVLDAPTTSSTASGSSGTSGGASGGTSGTVADAGSGSSSGGTACQQEVEPNNDRDGATPLVSSVCGTISPASDVDFLTFELPSTTKSVSLKYDGKVTLKVSVDGASSVILGAGSAGPIPFVKGKPYTVEIRPTTRADRVPWRVDLIMQ